MHRTWVLALVLGCGGGSKPATTPANTSPPAATADQCPRAADHVVDLMSQVAKDAPPEKIKAFKDTFVEHCQKDKWSAEMQKCVIDAQKQEDFEKCDAFLTPAQKQALGGEEGEEGGAPPPPPPSKEPPKGATKSMVPAQSAPAPGSRGPTKKSGDPCEGGE